MLLKLVKWLLLLVVLAVVAGLGSAWYVGAWHLIFPSHSHDVEEPLLPTHLGSPAILVFSKTNGFRHKEAIDAGQTALREIALEAGWDYMFTENGAVFNERQLARFRAVVFLNASGDMLSEPQEQVFQRWFEAGGGWVGVHAAGDDSHRDWRWYMDNLIGVDFTAHTMGPQFQRATVVTEAHEHPVNSGMPNVWEHEEEWYSWEGSPRGLGFQVLAVVDEDSYTPEQRMFGRERDLRMGDHPITWSHCVAAGRAVYTAVGHQGAAFSKPEIRRLLHNSLGWVMGQTGDGCAAP